MRNIFFLLFLFLSLAPDKAVSSISARSQGLCNASTASSRGLESVAWNPANLALSDGKGFEIFLPSFNIDANNNSFSLNRYNEVSGAYLTDADKQDILADIPDAGLRMNLFANATIIGIRSGNFALTVQGSGSSYGLIDKDVFDLVLLGNEVNHEFNFNSTDAKANAVGRATFSIAKPLVTNRKTRLSIGASAHYLYGIYGFTIDDVSGGLTTSSNYIDGNASASYMTATGGNGYAMDLGFSLQTPRGWNFGLAIENAIGTMKWDKSIEVHSWSANADSVNLSNPDISDQITTTDSVEDGEPWTDNLDKFLRLGCSKRFGFLLVAADVASPLQERAAMKDSPEFSFGFEFGENSFIQPRVGFGFGGSSERRLAAGVGLNIVNSNIDIAVASSGGRGTDYEESKGIAVATSMSLEF